MTPNSSLRYFTELLVLYWYLSAIWVNRSMSKNKDLAGERMGRLVVIKLTRREKRDATHYRSYWECKCDCGTVKEISQDSLSGGHSNSCGCLKRELCSERMITHGKTGSPEFKIWSGIKKRCFQKSSSGFHKYGARGITMCDRWRDSFENFLADMGEKKNGMTIERIDNNGNYEPSNCRWATALEQGQNKRNTIRIDHDGKSYSLRFFAGIFGVDYKRLHELYRTKGMPLNLAIEKARSSKSIPATVNGTTYKLRPA